MKCLIIHEKKIYGVRNKGITKYFALFFSLTLAVEFVVCKFSNSFPSVFKLTLLPPEKVPFCCKK